MLQRLLDLELVAKLRRSKGGSECSDPIGKRNVRRNNRLKPMQANRSRRVLSNGPLMNPADSETGTHPTEFQVSSNRTPRKKILTYNGTPRVTRGDTKRHEDEKPGGVGIIEWE